MPFLCFIPLILAGFWITQNAVGHPDVTWSSMMPLWFMIPLTFWVGQPWEEKTHAKTSAKPARTSWITAGILSVLGLLFDSLFCLAFSLGLISAAFISRFWKTNTPAIRVAILICLAFPWVAVDLQVVGWWFRMSSTAVVSELWSLFGSEVSHEGTLLQINGIPMSVEAACSGLSGLQIILAAGTLFASINASSNRQFWFALAVLPCFAWVVNAFRIFLISLLGVVGGPEAARGTLHEIIGVAVLALAIYLLSRLANRFSSPATP